MTAQAEITASLKRFGLAAADETPKFTALTGGVSSDIWRVALRRGPVCVKRACPKLKVTADWYAPVTRNAFEVAWMQTVARIAPKAVPPLLAHDQKANLFVMAYLRPDKFHNWKSVLASGDADAETARSVGRIMGQIHAATARDMAVAQRFASDDIFRCIRLEPYLGAAARAHPDLAYALDMLTEITADTKLALVHGDVSPKNIMVGSEGPVFLDAECAWYGDPAFDLAFCLNHLLLKCLWVPSATARFLTCFDALIQAYMEHVVWESPAMLETRAARLLPGLLLARVDGKSPVEYISSDTDKTKVRQAAHNLLTAPVHELVQVRVQWIRIFQT